MAQLYLFNLRLNICTDSDSSRGSSNNDTCNILSSCRILIWIGIVTSEAFSLTEINWFRLNSSWITVDDIKSRSQEKHAKLSSKFNLFLSHKMCSLFQCSLYYFAVWIICMSSSLFYFSRNVTRKNLPLALCFVKSTFSWQSAEIRLPYHVGSIYATLLALNDLSKHLQVCLQHFLSIIVWRRVFR